MTVRSSERAIASAGSWLTLLAMKQARACCVVLVTAPDLKSARRLARVALGARLVACANLIPCVESHYWWQGRIESGHEVMLVMKTTTERLPELERRLLAQHPYDTPEVLVLPIQAGNVRYLAWLAASVEQRVRPPARSVGPTARSKTKPRTSE